MTGAGFLYYTVYSTKTSTAYCADLKHIVGHLQMPYVICVTLRGLLAGIALEGLQDSTTWEGCGYRFRLVTGA